MGFRRSFISLVLLLLGVYPGQSFAGNGLATAVSGGSAQPRSAPVEPAAQPREFVNSVEDFLDHTRSHVERVVELGMRLRQDFPEMFREVDPALLREYLTHHDAAKVRLENSAHRDRTFAEDLYGVYGMNLRADPELNALHWPKVIELNQLDKKLSMDFLKKHALADSEGKLTETGKHYVLIENVADQVDRGLSEVSPEEFRKPKMELASEWMKDPVEKGLARHLEPARKILDVTGLAEAPGDRTDPSVYLEVVTRKQLRFRQYQRRNPRGRVTQPGEPLRYPRHRPAPQVIAGPHSSRKSHCLDPALSAVESLRASQPH
jgi:hypothetical protein